MKESTALYLQPLKRSRKQQNTRAMPRSSSLPVRSDGRDGENMSIAAIASHQQLCENITRIEVYKVLIVSCVSVKVGLFLIVPSSGFKCADFPHSDAHVLHVL